MKTAMRLLSVGGLLLALVGCEARTEKTDGGGVLLTISDFGTLPIVVQVNGDSTDPNNSGRFQIDELTIQNVPKELNGATGPLMNVELTSYQITYARADTGTRVPPTLVGSIFSNVPVGGNAVINNMPFLLPQQLATQPFVDLSNRGIDSETGSAVVNMRIGIQFFGKTLSGQNVATQVAPFSVQFVQ